MIVLCSMMTVRGGEEVPMYMWRRKSREEIRGKVERARGPEE